MTAIDQVIGRKQWFPVNVFGLNAVFEAVEDLWNTGGTFVAPTVARLHNIVSTSTSDDGAPVGVGARTVRVWGLTSWAAREVSEDIILNGTTDVPTVNSYVIINRLEVLTKGATNVNVGVITATAITDATVSATIAAGLGAAHNAILGVPSIQTLHLTQVRLVLEATTLAASIFAALRVNPEPDAELLNFVQRDVVAVVTTANADRRDYNPYLRIPGPAIVKLVVFSDTAAGSATGGFDGYLVNN